MQPSLHANAPDLWSLSYRSRAQHFSSRSDLDSLARQAQARNRKCGLTGMLLYEHGRFFQWLEGPQDALTKVWQAIKVDTRHHEVVPISNTAASTRLFSGWDLRVFAKPGEFDDSLGRFHNVAHQREFVRRIADLALQNNVAELGSLLNEFEGATGNSAHVAELVEAVSRVVGDDWAADHCSWVDVTLALSCLQTVIRADSRTSPPSATSADRLSVLVSTAPAETHLIGAAMAADKFRESGWDVEIAFPRTVAELVDAVKSNWLSAVTLSLSDVFARDERLSALKATISAVRAASRNPSLVVCVGGRAFSREPDLIAERVGADVAFLGADEAVQNTRMALLAKAQVKSGDAFKRAN